MGAMLSIHAFISAWRTSKKTDTDCIQGIEIVQLYTENEYSRLPLAVGVPIEEINNNSYMLNK